MNWCVCVLVGCLPVARRTDKLMLLYGHCCPLFTWLLVVKHNTQNPVIATSSAITFQHNPLRQCTALLVCTRNAVVFTLTDGMIQ